MWMVRSGSSRTILPLGSVWYVPLPMSTVGRSLGRRAMIIGAFFPSVSELRLGRKVVNRPVERKLEVLLPMSRHSPPER